MRTEPELLNERLDRLATVLDEIMPNCALLVRDALDLLKEREAEIRQLRLALDIAKGTCKGIKSGGGQFADMPTMQSAT